MRLPAAFYNEIVAHATEGQPEEVCGLIAGRDGRAVKLWRTTNSDPSPRVRYNVEPMELLNILREIESSGWTLMAIYHSHPATTAYPSATDISLAYYPDAVYIITSLSERQPAVRPESWRMRLLPFVAAPAWVATALGLLARGGASRRSSLGFHSVGSSRFRRFVSFLRGPLGVAALILSDVIVALLLKPASRLGPAVRGFKIVNGRVVQEPLVLAHDDSLPTTIQRLSVRERSL